MEEFFYCLRSILLLVPVVIDLMKAFRLICLWDAVQFSLSLDVDIPVRYTVYVQ